MRGIISRGTRLLALLVFFGAATFAHGQERNTPPPDCSRTDKTRPPLFMAYERAESRKVFLRLHNNSRCPVLIPTNLLSAPVRIVKQPNGGLKIEHTEELKDGSQVPVVYKLFNLRGAKGTVIVSDGCVVMTYRLMPQQSIIFTVPLDDFRKKADVGVEFNYPWEEDGGGAIGGGFGHYVFFHNESLPKGVAR